MGKHAKSVDTQVLGRITSHKRGWVFTAADFADLGSAVAVRLALMRHARAGTIRQLAHGLYDYPKKSRVLKGFVPPSDDDIAKALSGRNATRMQVSGGHAANMLGISTQVPMRAVYITDGPARKVKIGRREIVLKKASARQLATAGRVSGAVIQALKWIGQANVDDKVIATLKRNLTNTHKAQLLADIRYAPAWVRAIMRKIAEPQA